MARLVIADDHALLRSGLTRLLKHEHEIIGETPDGDATIIAVLAVRPDLLLLDLHMPRCEPAAMVARFRSELPGLRTIVMTGATDHSNLYALLGSGAQGLEPRLR